MSAMIEKLLLAATITLLLNLFVKLDLWPIQAQSNAWQPQTPIQIAFLDLIRRN
jgi:hypothetical protein